MPQEAAKVVETATEEADMAMEAEAAVGVDAAAGASDEALD